MELGFNGMKAISCVITEEGEKKGGINAGLLKTGKVTKR